MSSSSAGSFSSLSLSAALEEDSTPREAFERMRSFPPRHVRLPWGDRPRTRARWTGVTEQARAMAFIQSEDVLAAVNPSPWDTAGEFLGMLRTVRRSGR